MFIPCFGYLKTTLIDFPGEIASEIFLSGCNFHCSYCHNYKLATDANEAMSHDEFMAVLLDIKNSPTSGIVISGGEPTLWPALTHLLNWFREETNKKIKLDTNGSNPQMLDTLIKTKLVDCIAMDIKAPLHKYNLFTKARGMAPKVSHSINIIRKSGLPYYFRCTMGPEIDTEDIKNLKLQYPEIKFQKFIDRKEDVKNAQTISNIN